MDSNYRLMEGNLLIKRPQASQHGGIYQCIASNTIGTIVSREARVQFACKQKTPFSLSEQENVQVTFIKSLQL